MLNMQLVQESREPTGLGAQQAVEGFLSNKFMVVGGRPNYSTCFLEKSAQMKFLDNHTKHLHCHWRKWVAPCLLRPQLAESRLRETSREPQTESKKVVRKGMSVGKKDCTFLASISIRCLPWWGKLSLSQGADLENIPAVIIITYNSIGTHQTNCSSMV